MERDVDGFLFDVQTLYDRLLTLTEQRRRRGVRYELAFVLVMTVYLPEEGLVLMQVEVAGYTNEIPMAPPVMKVLDLQGKIVTGDVWLAHRARSTLIVEAGGDYV